jgi:GxxExxY protein
MQTQPDLTEQIIGAAFEVSNTLGAGFLEKVYSRALLRELHLRGLAAVPEATFAISYKGQRVGNYFADIVVENRVIVELKCADHLAAEHIAQCLNYLHASGLHLCLLFNFQKPTLEWKRLIRSSS